MAARLRSNARRLKERFFLFTFRTLCLPARETAIAMPTRHQSGQACAPVLQRRREGLRGRRFCREVTLKELKLFFTRSAQYSSLLFLVIAMCVGARAQQAADANEKSLAESVQELRTQVQELQAAVTEIKSEASQYRAESEELRKELESLRSAPPPASPAQAQQPITS